MTLLGLTGGIGMGKSTAAELFRNAGWPVADTDLIAHQIVEPGQPALAEIQTHFGADMIDPLGRLRRDHLAECVFADPARRRELESLLHPRIRQAWSAQAAQWSQEGRPAAVVVVPLLYEVASGGEFDRVLCVACSSPTQHRRLAERGWTPEHIARRLQAQWPVEKKMALADFVVWSEGGLPVLQAQLDRILIKCRPVYSA